MRGFFLGRSESNYRTKTCKRADCSRMFSRHVPPQAWASSNECKGVLQEARLQSTGDKINLLSNIIPKYSSSDQAQAGRLVQVGDQLAFTQDGLLQTPLQQLDSVSSKTQALADSLAEMRPAEDIPVYVMLPLDTVNADGVFRYAYIPWFAQALQVLALSGVHGVAVDIWWCAVERSPRQYNWTGYKQLFEMVRGTGLKLQVVLSFHACGGNVGDLAQIPLPSWVLEAGQQDPDIFFTDRPRESGLGQRNKEYLSIWADECPVLPAGPNGTGGRRTPMQAYADLMGAFRREFHDELGRLIEEVVVGTGPCGELRYPSYVEANGWRFPGVGEFQCYDRRALASLAAAATALGRPEWGYAGPHDSGGYNSSPGDTGFFAPGGSWGTDYGSFFLGWYSSCLLQHGERLLQIANQVFGPYKTPRQPPQGPLAQAQAVMRRLQSLVVGTGNTRDGLSSCSSNVSHLAAVAAAATVAATTAAGGGAGDAGDASSVAAATLQARGLLQRIQELQQQQQQHAAAPGLLAANVSGSSDADAGTNVALSPSSGSPGFTVMSCSSAGTSTGCLNTQGSMSLLPPVPEQVQQQQQEGVTGTLVTATSAPQAAAGAASSLIWDQLASPQAQALATRILQQLQLHSSGDDGSSLALMAAGPTGAADDEAGTAHASQAEVEATPCVVVNGHSAVSSSISSTPSGTMPTVSSVCSSSAQDLDLAGLLSASQQHLASLSLTGSDGSRASDMSSSSPRAGAAAVGADKPQLEPMQLPLSDSSNSMGAALASTQADSLMLTLSSSDVSMSMATPATANRAGVFAGSGVQLAGTPAPAPAVAALGAAAAAFDAGAASSHSKLMASVSGGSLTCLGAATAAAAGDSLGSMECTSGSSCSPENGRRRSRLIAAPAAAAATAAASAAGIASNALLDSFLEALAGLGLDVGSKAGQHHQQQPQHPRRRQQQQHLVVTLKIAGVHWWYNSTSHASELTAGYYNTDSRDGYTPILLLCEKYGVNLTLTCVEMCDAQHPSYALCGPEGLLRQIRAMAAKQQVTLSGENALPIFTPGGVDAVALDRVVSNVRACRAAPLRSCSSWPGPATTSGSTDPYCSSTNVGRHGHGGSSMSAYYQGGATYMGFNPYQQRFSSSSSPGGDIQQHGSSDAAGLNSNYGLNRSCGSGQQHSCGQHQQHHAYHHHYGAGMGGISNILSTGRTFSELGTLLACDATAAAAAGGSGGGGGVGNNWQQEQGYDASSGSRAVSSSAAGNHGTKGHPAGSDKGAAVATQQCNASGDVLLPAMRAFTFLRLGPEILQPECHASWMRFMHRMLNERA